MATGGEDAKVNIWAVGKTSPLLSLSGHSCAVESVALDWPEEIVVAGAHNGCIKLWDLEHSKVIRTLTGHKAATHRVEFHPFGDFFASGSLDDSIKIWDVRRKGCIQTYLGNKDIECMRITPDGRWIATGSQDGIVRLWDMTAGKLLQSLQHHSSPIFSLVFSPLEFTMYTMSEEGRMVSIDLQSWDTLKTSVIPRSSKQASFHPDGQLLYIAHSQGIQVWSKELECVASSSIPWSNVADVKVLVEEDKMIVGSIDQNIVSMWGVNVSNLVPSAHVSELETRLSQSTVNVETRLLQSTTNLETRLSQSTVNVETRKLDPLPPVSSTAPPVTLQETPPRNNTPSLKPYSSRPSTSEPAPKVTHRGSFSSQAQPLIPASTGDRVIGLDVSKFAKEANKPLMHKAPSAGSLNMALPTNDQDVLDSMFARHASIVSILKKRLNNVRLVKQSWDDGFSPDYSSHSIKPAIECMVHLGDSAIWIDILRMLNIRPKLMGTLDICESLLPILGELVFESYEDYIVTACTTIKLLTKNFSQLILSTVNASSIYQSPGVDITREERLHRCQSCLEGFQSLVLTLNELRNSPGHVGITVRDTLKELAVFQ